MLVEQFKQFGLRWIEKSRLHNVPAHMKRSKLIRSVAALAPNDYGISANIHRRRRGFTYSINGKLGRKTLGYSFPRAYESVLQAASEEVLKMLHEQIACAERTLSGQDNRYNSISYSPGPNGTVTTVRDPDGNLVGHSSA
jgi:hypothetical protein